MKTDLSSPVANFPGCPVSKEFACSVRDPGRGRSPGEGNGKPLQYFCLENPMEGGASWATVHGVAKSWTQMSNFTLCLLFEKWVVHRLSDFTFTFQYSCLENLSDLHFFCFFLLLLSHSLLQANFQSSITLLYTQPPLI